MPSVKPSIKSLGRAASKASFINVPRIETPPRYNRWLKHLLATPHNKRAAEACQKVDVDHLYREHASQQFKKNDQLLRIAFAETISQASEKAWKLFVPQSPVQVPKALAEQVAKLRLPRVANRGQRVDVWQSQTYQAFADQDQRKNRDVSFTKDLMDEALRTAVSLVPKSANGGIGTDRENMLTRCLGKESKEYWKT